MYLAVLASMVHGLTVPGSIEVAQRMKGYNNGLFEWLRKAPWGNPAFAGIFLSILIFGFLGGISGVMMGTEQLNLIIHNTIYVPGHFHATVATGTTLAFMAVTYFLIPTLFRRKIMFEPLAKYQPYLFGIGMAGVALFMMGAGTLGVPRRHWDISFAGNVFGYEFPGAAWLMMGLMGVSALVAFVGGALYLLITVGSVFLGEKIETPGFTHVGVREGVGALPAAAPARGGAGPEGRACRDRRLGHGGAGNLRAGARVPRFLRAVLLRQLEVPVDRLAIEVTAPKRPCARCSTCSS